MREAEKDFAEAQFRKAGFTNVQYISAENTQCYVVSNDNFIVVAFRGTECRRHEREKDFREIIEDIKTDADIRLVHSGKKGSVQRGFRNGLDHVWNEVDTYVKGIHRDDRKMWITGHSLGAALAVCKIPPSGIYQHTGELRHIDSNGKIHDDPKKWERLTDDMKGKVENT